MAKGKQSLLEVKCPCCEAELKVDAATGAVIAHKAPEKPRPIEDIAAAVADLKGAEARREDAFQKSFAAHKTHHDVLSKKFDELFKQAQENPDAPPPPRDIDL
jgi:hypothetical protein